MCITGTALLQVYSVSGTSARRLLERLVVQQEEAEQEEPQRLEQAKQHLQQALVQPQDPQDLQQQQQARSRALLQTGALLPLPRADSVAYIQAVYLLAVVCFGVHFYLNRYSRACPDHRFATAASRVLDLRPRCGVGSGGRPMYQPEAEQLQV